jgi:hypothetical protein
VNAVTLGDFEEPLKISVFAKDLFASFSMVSPKSFVDGKFYSQACSSTLKMMRCEGDMIA